MKRTLTQPALALAATAVLVVGVAHPASATVTVSGGSVTGDGANDFFSVQCTGGVLAASPAVTTGDACATLDSLYVDPGPGTDTVNLTNVTAAAFPSLAGISVYTSDSEADTVNGSPLSETLSGDSLDTISGGGGGDLIVGANSASGGDGDDSFMEILALVCDDDTFRHWKLGGLSLWMDSNVDVPRMVYRHALVCEYAHARLVKLAGGAYPRETPAAFD